MKQHTLALTPSVMRTEAARLQKLAEIGSDPQWDHVAKLASKSMMKLDQFNTERVINHLRTSGRYLRQAHMLAKTIQERTAA